MKKLLTNLFLVAGSLLCMATTGCSGGNQYAISCEGSIYNSYAQTLTLKLGDDEGTFSEKISKDNFVLSEDFGDKIITNVEYVSEKEIKVTFDGNTNKTFANYSYIKFNIKGGMNGDKAECVVRAYGKAPYMYCLSHSYIGTTYYSSEYLLCYGEFVSEYCTSDYISLKDGNGVMTISLEDNVLSVETTFLLGYEGESGFPTIQLSEKCTTFNKSLEATVGKIGEFSF